MNCPYCGTNISKNQVFCPKCGNRIINHIITNDYELSNNKELEIFIDRNSKKILSQKFSFPTMFFGATYCLYRKMYLLAFLFIALNIPFFILLNIVDVKYGMIFMILYFIIYLVIDLLISIKFNSLYINHANVKINKIKNKNFKLSNYEISERIKYSGGTNLLIPSIFIALIVIINMLLFKYQFNNYNDQLSNNEFKVKSMITDTNASLYLNEDKSFIWYLNKDNKNDNYYVGSYDVFSGNRAIAKSKNYNINTDRINNIDNYYLLILKVDRVVSNNNVNSINSQLIYYGVYDKKNDSIDLNNINGSDYFELIKIKS